MPDSVCAPDLLGALRNYLEELQASGVDALPYAPQACPATTLPPVQGAQSPVGDGLETILGELQKCGRCSLGKTRTNLVFGVGNPHARVVFVGEAPGRDEDLKGEPFVGEAGQLLTKIIQAMGFARDEIYICNVLKCRPPNNRNPQQEEIDQCEPFLLRQVKAVDPEVIVCLGTFAAHTLLKTKEPISKLRGRFHDYHGIPLMPTFHPAFLLRNPAMKREVWSDIQQVMSRLAGC